MPPAPPTAPNASATTHSAAQRGRQAAGMAAAAHIQSGMVVGLGTGDTAAAFIRALADRVRHREVSDLRCVATSLRSAQLGRELGLLVVELDDLPTTAAHPIDITVDGADEISPQLQLTKGAGGALLFEKLVARCSRQLIIVADPAKLVARIGEQRRLPVEIVPFGSRHTLASILRTHRVQAADLRMADTVKPYVTDGGHYIVDVQITPADAPQAATLHAQLKALPGVVETGLFLQEAALALIGDGDGQVRQLPRPTP